MSSPRDASLRPIDLIPPERQGLPRGPHQSPTPKPSPVMIIGRYGIYLDGWGFPYALDNEGQPPKDWRPVNTLVPILLDCGHDRKRLMFVELYDKGRLCVACMQARLALEGE